MAASLRAEDSLDPVGEAIGANRSLLVSGLIVSALMSVLALTTSIYMLQVYDRVLSSRSEDTLLLVTVMAVAGIGAFAALDALRSRMLMRLGMRVADRLSMRVLRAVVAVISQSGGMNARSGLRDVETIRNFLGSPSLSAFMDAPFILIYLIVLYLLSPVLLGIVIVGGAVIAGIALTNQRTSNPGIARSLGLLARTNEFAEDGMRNADVLEGMGMSASFAARWRDRWLEAQRVNAQASDMETGYSAASKAVRMLIQIFLLGAGALLILDYHSTGGIMIAASIIGSRALAPIETIVASWKSVVATKLAWQRVTSLLEHAPKRDERMKLPAPKGRIDVQGASFVVRSSGTPILQNVAFSLLPGESLGIIGPSASGKSTLLRLLVGAWPCHRGAVRLDGANIYEWPRADLSKYIGYLPQDVELFDGTVRENIARMSDGDPDAIVRAAQRAGAHEMILSLPEGYDTEVGGGGHRLSGGQSQRIGIARALFGNPRLVVLDEPNSNLDGQGETALCNTLTRLQMEGVTVIVVAHRPNILSQVDKMLVLAAGGTVEAFGPREEAMRRYARRGNVVPLPQAEASSANGAERREGNQ
jgi:PrtD family type I secretion system ABC transporter